MSTYTGPWPVGIPTGSQPTYNPNVWTLPSGATTFTPGYSVAASGLSYADWMDYTYGPQSERFDPAINPNPALAATIARINAGQSPTLGAGDLTPVTPTQTDIDNLMALAAGTAHTVYNFASDTNPPIVNSMTGTLVDTSSINGSADPSRTHTPVYSSNASAPANISTTGNAPIPYDLGGPVSTDTPGVDIIAGIPNTFLYIGVGLAALMFLKR